MEETEVTVMETMKLAIFRLLLKKYALGYLVKGWEKTKGYKTAIFTVLTILTYAGEQFGYVPKELAAQLYTLFGGGAGFSFMQKLQRYQPYVDEVKKALRG